MIHEKKTNQSFMIPRHGITENKKAELDSLAIEVLDASHEVEQFQAITAALSEKLAVFQAALLKADNDRTLALNNRDSLFMLIRSTMDLKDNAGIAFNEMTDADAETKKVAAQTKLVMDKLIYSAEMINKLSNQVIRRKALNPLISDELVSMVTAAGNDANKAVALALVSLKASIASQASNMESEAANAQTYLETLDFYQLMTGNKDTIADDQTKPTQLKNGSSLKELLDNAYSHALQQYEKTSAGVKITTEQLNNALAGLNKAQVKLRSLQSGLAAGNAAALAS